MKINEQPTPEEVEYLVKEVYERLKDVFYIQGERSVRVAVEMALDTMWEDPDTEEITFTYSVKMVRGDFRQIIGRLRRGEDIHHL